MSASFVLWLTFVIELEKGLLCNTIFLGDNMESQMLKGVIEGVILQIIKNKETYGYEIVENLRLNGFYNMTESTVYPILQRLSNKGLILSSKEKSKLGPKRKYHYITPKGEEYLEEFKESFRELERLVGNIIGD